jgi:hypothetical protein
LKEYRVTRYVTSDYLNWNAFVDQAKNATFLFHRDFMEYHQDRFEDFSLLIFEKNKIVAILPANRLGDTVYSHQGLTYGGLVLLFDSKLSDVIYIFKALLNYLNNHGIAKLNLKKIPSIYCDTFSDEIDYLIYICKGITVMKHNVSVIKLDSGFKISKSRRECINRGNNRNLIIKEETNLETFWNELLIPNLMDKYGAKPVHTLDEIMHLRSKFPNNIRHFNVYDAEALVCGTTVFITKNTVKPQYISGSEHNNALGSIDFLYHYLITAIAKNKTFFDLGPSHENNGLSIVKNINFWKESFGAHSLVQEFYEVETANHFLLDTVLI